MLKIHGLGHINIIVDDIDAATTYYQDLLGATPEQLFLRCPPWKAECPGG